MKLEMDQLNNFQDRNSVCEMARRVLRIFQESAIKRMQLTAMPFEKRCEVHRNFTWACLLSHCPRLASLLAFYPLRVVRITDSDVFAPSSHLHIFSPFLSLDFHYTVFLHSRCYCYCCCCCCWTYLSLYYFIIYTIYSKLALLYENILCLVPRNSLEFCFCFSSFFYLLDGFMYVTYSVHFLYHFPVIKGFILAKNSKQHLLFS